MNRKDTILIAVVVNSALLITLFATAMTREDKIVSAPPVQEIESMPKVAKIETPKKIAKGDEVDQVLKELTTKEEKAPKAIDFAKELEAITKAAAPAVEKPAQQVVRGQVTVKKGDSLDKIARAHGVTVNGIVSANNLTNTVLQIGQVLKLPEKGASAPAETEGYYTVKQGDNPWTIAVKNHLKVDQLLKLNNLNEEKARRLRPGDKLRIK